MSEANADEQSFVSKAPVFEEAKNDVPAFKTIRCVCGDNRRTNCELFPCPNCHCYLHRDCLDPAEMNQANFKCQFCRLQQDGIDPFRELKAWIGNVDSELRVIHRLVTDVTQYENQAYQSGIGGDFGISNMRNRQNTTPPKSKLNKTVSEIVQRLSNITKS